MVYWLQIFKNILMRGFLISSQSLSHSFIDKYVDILHRYNIKTLRHPEIRN